MKFNNDPTFLKKREEAYKQKKANPNSGSPNRDYIFSEPVNLYKVHDGENNIRLCPNPDPEALFPWIEIFVHYNIGANGSQYLCLAKMKNKVCPICEEHKVARDEGRPDTEVNALRPQQRSVAYIVDRLEQDLNKALSVWPMPYKKVAQNILGISFKARTGEPMYFDDPEKGYDVYFEKTGKELNTDYKSIRRDDEPSPLHAETAIANKWLNHIEAHSLHKILSFKSYEHIKASLHGEDAEVVEKPITSNRSKVAEEANGRVNSTTSGLSLSKLQSMSRADLESLISEKDLEIDSSEWPETEELAQAVALDLGISS